MTKQVETLVDSIMYDFETIKDTGKLKLILTDRLDQFERECTDDVKNLCIEAVERVNP